MSVTYLGSMTIGQGMPQYSLALSSMLSSLAAQITGLIGDIAALQADIVSLQADAAQALASITDLQGLADAMMAQLAAGPQAVIDGINAAIQAITLGLTLAGLQQAILDAPTIVMNSLQAALGEALAKVANAQAVVAGFMARIADILRRIAALEGRLDLLSSLQGVLQGYNTTLAAAGIHAFVCMGPAASLGTEIESAVSPGLPGGTGPGESIFGLLFATNVGASWTALSNVLRVV